MYIKRLENQGITKYRIDIFYSDAGEPEKCTNSFMPYV